VQRARAALLAVSKLAAAGGAAVGAGGAQDPSTAGTRLGSGRRWMWGLSWH